MDDAIDNINREIYEVLQKVMREDDPRTVNRAVQLLSASRYLERIVDLTTNIAEDVMFMVEGNLFGIAHRLSLNKII